MASISAQPPTPSPASPPLLERFKYPIFALIGLALLAGVGIVLWRQPEPTTITVNPPAPTAIPSPTPIPSSTPTPGPYMVYITGAVATSEVVVTLDYGSRVKDALLVAGGPLANADLEIVNLAQILEDGDQVHVPTREAVEDTAVPPTSKPAVTATIHVVTPTAGTIEVYVVGEVVQPESTVVLAARSRVEDAIAAVGGATDNADLSRVNLSQMLNDGDYIYVPPLEGDTIQTPTPNHAPVIHLNEASLEELDSLPGIGPSLAQAIIDYRTENGPFTSLEDLDNVPGIGPSKLEGLRDLVVFD